MNGWGVQWHGSIFLLQKTSLKMSVLLHKTALVNFPMATTVYEVQCAKFWNQVCMYSGVPNRSPVLNKRPVGKLVQNFVRNVLALMKFLGGHFGH